MQPSRSVDPRKPRHAITSLLLWSSICVGSICDIASSVQAQSAALAPLRETLSAYDLAGSRTLGALRDLAAIRPSLRGAATDEARFLRAYVATDFLIAARLVPGQSGLEERLGDALGVARGEIVPHLRAELSTLERGVYLRQVRDALATLDALDHPSAARFSRSEYAVLSAAAPALERGTDEIAALAPDPCARTCGAPFRDIDVSSRRALSALREVSRAMARIERSAERGDPLAAATRELLHPIAARAESIEVRPSVVLPRSAGLDDGPSEGEIITPDLLLILDHVGIKIGRTPRYRIARGEVVASEEPVASLPELHAVALPSELRPLIVPIDEFVDALSAIDVPDGATIGLATTSDVPAHLMARVFLSAARANRIPTHLVRRTGEGTLRGVPVARLEGDPGAVGDVVVRLRLGGYGVARGRSGEQVLPRIRNAEGALEFDRAALLATIARTPRRRTIVDAMGSVPAREVVDLAFDVSAGQEVVYLR